MTTQANMMAGSQAQGLSNNAVNRAGMGGQHGRAGSLASEEKQSNSFSSVYDETRDKSSDRHSDPQPVDKMSGKTLPPADDATAKVVDDQRQNQQEGVFLNASSDNFVDDQYQNDMDRTFGGFAMNNQVAALAKDTAQADSSHITMVSLPGEAQPLVSENSQAENAESVSVADSSIAAGLPIDVQTLKVTDGNDTATDKSGSMASGKSMAGMLNGLVTGGQTQMDGQGVTRLDGQITGSSDGHGKTGASLTGETMDAIADGLSGTMTDKLMTGSRVQTASPSSDILDNLLSAIDMKAQAATDNKFTPALSLAGQGQTTSLQNSHTATGIYQSVMTDIPGSGDWDNSFSKQVVWMSQQHIRQAEIRLNPANLGSIEVSLKMDDDKLDVHFGSQHAQVRDAIEQAMPRLREMMKEQGLSLADTSVSEQAFQNNESRHEQSERALPTPAKHDYDSSVDIAPIHHGRVSLEADTMVDYYI